MSAVFLFFVFFFNGLSQILLLSGSKITVLNCQQNCSPTILDFSEKYLGKQITTTVEQRRVLQGNHRCDQRVLCCPFLWNVLYVYPSFS